MPVVILKNVRLSFPDLWKPGKPMNEGDTPKYGGQFIYAPDSDAAKAAGAAFVAAAKEVFGENWNAIVGAMEKSKKCIRDGNLNLDKEGRVRDGYKDMKFIVARNKIKPLVIGGRKDASGNFPTLTEEGGKPYGGCYVNVKVDIKAMKAKEKIPNQVYATLLTVQYVADGPSFGAAPGTSEGFDEVEGATADSVDDSDLF
jgi:hypothetical protein